MGCLSIAGPASQNDNFHLTMPILQVELVLCPTVLKPIFQFFFLWLNHIVFARADTHIDLE